MDDLDTFLDTGTKPAEVTTEPEAAPPPETIGQPRDENGRFAPKQTGVEPQEPVTADAEPVPPTGKLPRDVYEPLKAVRDENKALKDRLAALEQQLQTPQQPKEPEAPPPSIWEDEQGWQQHFGGQVAQQAAFNARLDMSEMLASQAHEDFDAVKAKFLEMAQGNPALAQQALQAKHPWEKAYQIAKNAETMAQLGATNLDELRAKLREEIAAEMKATPPAAPALPQSLADAQSAKGPASNAPQMLSLADIIGR